MGDQAYADRRRRRRAYVFSALCISILLLGALWYNCGINGCPNVARLNSYQPGGATLLFDAAGEQFADLSTVDNEAVELSSLPAYIPCAFITVYEHRFHQKQSIQY